MGVPAKENVEIADFAGMASNFDPNDIKPGVAREQVNVNGLQRGQLEVRRGMRLIEFEDD